MQKMVLSKNNPIIPILRKYPNDEAPNFLTANMELSLTELGKKSQNFL